MKRIPTVGIVAIKEGKVVLVKHKEAAAHLTGMYGLPAGRLFTGETELDAAVREFAEETGLKATKKDFSEFPNNYYEATIPRKSGIEDFTWRVFKVNKFSGELKSSEEVTPEWIEIDKMDDLERKGVLLPNTINAVKAAANSS